MSEIVTRKIQDRVNEALNRASRLARDGDVRRAIQELETSLADARSSPYEVEFATRVQLALTLADLYLSVDEPDRASEMIMEEAAFADKIVEITRFTGSAVQKRSAAGFRVQVRDRASQVALIGQPAPEISVKQWLTGEPATLEALRGQVVLLEFWATWCKPCAGMFPKLKRLDEEYRARGLEIIALTRHYFAQRNEASSVEEELNLMRGVIAQHELEFRAGVMEDERLQETYGATGLPTLVLIDRSGIVRDAGPGGGDDVRFKQLLLKHLGEDLS
ncbi:MAG TPA: TlpA disulfide reductase family protein [Pyrinomonadaceae bacterium]|nr:TlpA disulfide reductase family protein [Pyrinomonadaceae bacterium]